MAVNNLYTHVLGSHRTSQCLFIQNRWNVRNLIRQITTTSPIFNHVQCSFYIIFTLVLQQSFKWVLHRSNGKTDVKFILISQSEFYSSKYILEPVYWMYRTNCIKYYIDSIINKPMHIVNIKCFEFKSFERDRRSGMLLCSLWGYSNDQTIFESQKGDFIILTIGM